MSKQTGSIATVRMGGVLTRAIATGVAARSITAAEQQIRELRGAAKFVNEGHKNIMSGLRVGHAETRMQHVDGLNKERQRMKSSALWCLDGDHSSVAARGHSSQVCPSIIRI